MASRSSPGADVEPTPEEVELSVLRDRVACLETTLEERERELEASREWADFLEASLEERRDRITELEARVERLENGDRAPEHSPTGLIGRALALLG